MSIVADALRKVTLAMQRALDSGQRTKAIDADDLIEVLLAVADELDPALADLVTPADSCPGCGERHPDQLIWHDDETVHCFGCGTKYQPGQPG